MTAVSHRLHGRFVQWTKRWSRAGLYEAVDAFLADLSAGAVVLDVGAGGEIETCVRRAASAAALITVDLDAGRGPGVVADLEALPLRSGSVDSAVVAEVLEHVRRPPAAAAELRRVLRPGGRLLVTTPFAFPLHDRPHDFQRFTRYGLEVLLSDLEDVRVEARNGYWSALAVLVLRLGLERGARPKLAAAVAALFGLPQLCRLLDRVAPADGITTGYVATAMRGGDPRG